MIGMTALVDWRVPFIFFPVENQAEQEITIADRLARHGAGLRMNYSTTSPQDLAGAIEANLNLKVSYPNIPVDGARLAAIHVLECVG